jgi:hypothetical protein
MRNFVSFSENFSAPEKKIPAGRPAPVAAPFGMRSDVFDGSHVNTFRDISSRIFSGLPLKARKLRSAEARM